MKSFLPYLLIVLLLVAACSPAAEQTPSSEDISTPQNNTSNADTTTDDTQTTSTQPQAATAAYDGPTWAQFELVNARTGETFSLADFAGRTVFVEPMATWCPNCRNQQYQVATARPNLDSEQYVFISLSVGEFIEDQDLAIYADNYGFSWIFAIATEELVQALLADFGYTVQSPPSTPHFTISPAGVVSSLSSGFHNPDAIIAEVTAVNNS